MQLTATSDFTAHVNGQDFALKRGEAFDGGKQAAGCLMALGLLEVEKEPETAKGRSKAKEETK